MEESARAHLLFLAAKLSEADGVSLQTIGQRALKDNTFFARIGEGSGFTFRTYDRLVKWFADNWPEGTEWPAEIIRPAGEAAE